MAVNDSFNSLVNDLTQKALEQAQETIRDDLVVVINQRLDEFLSTGVIERIVTTRVEQQISQFTPDLTKFEEGLQSVANTILAGLDLSASKQITNQINQKIHEIDVNALIDQAIASQLELNNFKIPFKDKTIAGTAIDTTGLTISGDNIVGGVVTGFASTGIEDKASRCQVTVLDQGTVFENTVYATRVEVKGGAIIDGDLTILGNITDNPAYQKLIADASTNAQMAIGPAVLDAYQDRVFERIQQEGLNLNKIKIDGQSVVEGDRLTSVVRHSQLQSLGTIRDLQTDGEALLSQTLYVSNNRVGVNTMDPNTALSIWDEEIEIGIGKQSQGVARISAARDQILILGSNKHNNITLTPDGATAIPKLQLGNMLFSTSSTPPQYDAPRGSVVFNEVPSLGGPLGWVSLGSARWANFGIID
jgi:hypothetical protein